MQASIAYYARTLAQPGLCHLIAPQSNERDADTHTAIDRLAHAPLLRCDLIEAEPVNPSERFHTIPPSAFPMRFVSFVSLVSLASLVSLVSFVSLCELVHQIGRFSRSASYSRNGLLI